MARINVEDSLQGDIRFVNLTLRLGSMKLALGELVWAWKLGQKFYLKPENDRCIPFGEWEKQECNEHIVGVGLAERRDKGIWIVGAEKQFGWLEQRQKAGEKSGEARKGTKKQSKKSERSLTVVEKTEQNSNGSEPLSSYLSSLSSNLKLSLPISLLNTIVERVFDDSYPRKIGLPGGKKILLDEIKTLGDAIDFNNAVLKYRDFVADAENEVTHIYGFKGFAEVWRQWLPKQTHEESA